MNTAALDSNPEVIAGWIKRLNSTTGRRLLSRFAKDSMATYTARQLGCRAASLQDLEAQGMLVSRKGSGADAFPDQRIYFRLADAAVLSKGESL